MRSKIKSFKSSTSCKAKSKKYRQAASNRCSSTKRLIKRGPGKVSSISSPMSPGRALAFNTKLATSTVFPLLRNVCSTASMLNWRGSPLPLCRSGWVGAFRSMSAASATLPLLSVSNNFFFICATDICPKSEDLLCLSPCPLGGRRGGVRVVAWCRP